LKETNPGEGVLNDLKERTTFAGYGEEPAQSVVRQFTFVVGSPEQENNFKQEIVKAKSEKPSCEQYPTLLAFHGELPSATI
jgi:ubiquitin-conjugating enzyme E2 Q